MIKLNKKHEVELTPDDDYIKDTTCYLAGPFENLETPEAIKLHKSAAAFLALHKYSPYSPILNAVPIWLDTKEELPDPWWEHLEEPLIQSLDFFVLIVRPQSFFSEGVRRELARALQHHKPIRFLLPSPSETFILVDAQV